MTINPKDIRQYLTNAYSDEDLDIFCADYFRDVYNNFTAGMAKAARIQRLLDHCHHRVLMPHLEVALERDRPDQYQERFGRAEIEPSPVPKPPARDPRPIFISYAHEDAEFAHRLADDLRRHDWRVWIAPNSIRPGEKWTEAIGRGLEECGVFILALTPAAVGSKWVESETAAAIQLEHKNKVRFVPVEVVSCNVPALWATYQSVSFRGAYETGLAALLDALDSPGHRIPPPPPPLDAFGDPTKDARKPRRSPSSISIGYIIAIVGIVMAGLGVTFGYLLLPTFLPHLTQTPTYTPSPSSTPTPSNIVVDDMAQLSAWSTFIDGRSAITPTISSTPGILGNAIQIDFNLRPDTYAYVGISREITPALLSGTQSMRFRYKQGTDQAHTIELKFLYKPGADGRGEVFSYARRESIAPDSWVTFEQLYSVFSCGDTCKNPGQKLNPAQVWKLEIAISQQLGGTPGPGRITIDQIEVSR